jgi:hypothetical protein
MKVRWGMIAEKYLDDDTVESGNLWHNFFNEDKRSLLILPKYFGSFA